MACCNCIGPIGDCPCIRKQRLETEKAFFDMFNFGAGYIKTTRLELKDLFKTPETDDQGGEHF